MPENTMGPARMVFLLYDCPGEKAGGAILYSPDFYSLGKYESLIYLDCQPDLQIILNKVHNTGGQTFIQKKKFRQGLVSEQ